jgi:threonine/homoserine/homoserine lactone efflux protein
VHPRAKAQRIEMLIGVLGFFTAAAFIQTVILELRGRPALRSAMLLLGFVVLLWLAIRWRRRSRPVGGP